MSYLRFDGQGAGLGFRAGGDLNSPNDWMIVCTCGVDIGTLATCKYVDSERRLDPKGIAMKLCSRCENVTKLKEGVIMDVFPLSRMQEEIVRCRLAEVEHAPAPTQDLIVEPLSEYKHKARLLREEIHDMSEKAAAPGIILTGGGD